MSLSKRALVLSGGGARGAYEAGVLAYIYQHLPKHMQKRARASLFCGTSVGALHACFLASTAQMPENNINTMLDVWRSLKLRELLQINTRDILRLPTHLRALWRTGHKPENFVFNVPLLHDLICRNIAWPQIRRNIEQGHMDGLTVSTTHVTTGHTVVFIEHKNGLPSWTRDPRRRAQLTQIGPLHALASAAIPILFPPISIAGAYFCDGGLRQNTPLSPALRLGADKVLVISVGHGTSENRRIEQPSGLHQLVEKEVYPGVMGVLGKVFNALLLDHLDYDLAQLQGFNQLLEDGENAFGSDFLKQLGDSTKRIRGASYRAVKPLVIRPSQDLGDLVAKIFIEKRPQLGGLIDWFIGNFNEPEIEEKADFLSYLCFDGLFADKLIELGMHDADANREALIQFFQD